MKLTRRRFLVVAAGLSVGASIARAGPAWEWRGSALGGEALVRLQGERSAAEAALAAVVSEIKRLEAIFSLQRPDSQISRLNAKGVLSAPALDLVRTLECAERWRRRSEGAFDPRVQPLWRALAEGTSRAEDLVHLGGTIEIAPAEIRLAPGTEITLNGIAQGTVADRVVETLARHGFDDVLVDTGEMRLPGRHRRRVQALGWDLSLAETAVAVSEPEALRFTDGSGHILDPREPGARAPWRAVAVLASSAEQADALSTAFALSSAEQIGDLTTRLHGVAVLAEARDGSLSRFGESKLLRRFT